MALTVVFVVAIGLLFLESTTDHESSVKPSQMVLKNDTVMPVETKSVQSSSNTVLENLTLQNIQEDIVPPQIEDVDLSQRIGAEMMASPENHNSLNSTPINEELILNSDSSSKPILNDIVKAEKQHRTVDLTNLQSDSENETRDPLIIGGKEIAGKVINQNEDKITGVTIQLYLQRPGPDAPESSISRRTQSDTGGEFLFENLYDGDYRLIISEEQNYADYSYSTRAGVSTLVIVLADKNSVTIQGHVSDFNNESLSGVNVSLGGRVKAQTDDTGNYQIIDTLDSNSNHRISFFLDEYSEVNDIVKISSNVITIDKQLNLKSQLQLTGRIIDEYGTPLTKAAIWLQSRSAEIERRTTSDDDGYFLIEDLKSVSDYQLTATYSAHEKFSLNSLSITESSQPMRIELKALATGSVSGSIVNSNGYPVSDYAMKILNNKGSAGAKIITSDSAGQFEAVSVYEGAIQINSMVEPRSSISGLKLAAGQDLFVTLVVDHGDDEIYGNVIDEKGRAIPNAQIHMTWSHSYDGMRSNSNRRLQSNIEGNYRFQNVGPGAHLLMVSAPGFKNSSVEVKADQQVGPLAIVLEQ